MRFDDLEKANVGILGMGREGRSVWRHLRTRFPDKPLFLFAETAVDAGFESQLDPGLDHIHLGPFDVAMLGKYDVLVRSAGISPYRDELQRLSAQGLKFTSASNLWFAENPGARTICITGTMGKSTTAALTAHLLDAAGVKVRLAGNIGRPMLDCANGDVEWWVIELSSYQLSDLEAKPDIALLLNLSEEHIDWHGGVTHYQSDKLRLAALAGPDRVIANIADPVLVEKLANHPGIGWFNHDRTWRVSSVGVTGPEGRQISAPVSLPGTHNMQNLAAALTVVDRLGFDVPRLDEVLASFSGLPHRLQLLGVKKGIRYVDDSISTTPVSVAAALRTIGYEDVVLILGGLDRGLDWSGFAREVTDRCPHAIITIPDNGPLIFDCLGNAGVLPKGGLHQASQLEHAVALAQQLVPEDGCILLSPGAPSFPHFRDFEERGKLFKNYSGIEKSP